jgi:hypothetical protein
VSLPRRYAAGDDLAFAQACRNTILWQNIEAPELLWASIRKEHDYANVFEALTFANALTNELCATADVAAGQMSWNAYVAHANDAATHRIRVAVRASLEGA